MTPGRSGSGCSATARSARLSTVLLGERAGATTAATGRRPELCGVLTRSRGSFDEILEGADAIVELIGGIEPAREYVLRALGERKPVVTANKQLLSRHGDELFSGRARGRRAASLRGGCRRSRAGDPRDAGVFRRRAHREGARDRERDDQLHPHRDGANGSRLRRRAHPRAGARVRGGGPDRGRHRRGCRREDGDPRAACVPRLRPSRSGAASGSRGDNAGRHRLREGVRARPEASRRGRAPRRRRQRARLSCFCTRVIHLRRSRPLQRGDAGVGRDHRDHAVRSRGGGDRDRLGGARRRGVGNDFERNGPRAAGRASARAGRGGRVGVLPSPGGRGSAWRPRRDRQDPRRQRREREERRAEGPRRAGAARHDRALRARGELHGGGGHRSRISSSCARRPARSG